MQTIKQRRVEMGLKSRELAQRLGVSAARVSVLERDEDRGAVTLAMLEKAAQALDCRLQYQLVPRQQAGQGGDKPRVRLDADGNIVPIAADPQS